jgi:hypothetical protein
VQRRSTVNGCSCELAVSRSATTRRRPRARSPAGRR